jgi:hypothetical protein
MLVWTKWVSVLVVSLFERSMCTQPLSQGKYESICVESYLYLHCKFKHYNGVDNILDVRAIALFFWWFGDSFWVFSYRLMNVCSGTDSSESELDVFHCQLMGALTGSYSPETCHSYIIEWKDECPQTDLILVFSLQWSWKNSKTPYVIILFILLVTILNAWER